MTIELWLLFLVIITVFLAFGYKYKIPILVMTGWITLFLIAGDFELNGFEYSIGLNQTIVNTSNTVAYDIMASYESHTIGFILLIISALAFISVFFTTSLWRNNDDV